MRDIYTPRLVLKALRERGKKDVAPAPSLGATTRRLAAGAVGLLGVSGILYGIGFLILRSRFSFLGIWGGAPLSSSEIAEEGGKFFYHHVFIPASLLIRLFSSLDLLLTGAVLVVAALVWWLARKLPSWRPDGRAVPPVLRRLRRLREPLDAFLPVLAVIFCAAIYEFVWQIVSLEDVLRAPNELFLNLRLADASARAFYYHNVLTRVAMGVALSVWLLWVRWPRAGYVQRVVIAAQLVLTATAAASLPVAYGKLMSPATFREVSIPDTKPDEPLLLVSHAAGTWVVWNSKLKRTEVHKPPEKAPVVVGARRNIFE